MQPVPQHTPNKPHALPQRVANEARSVQGKQRPPRFGFLGIPPNAMQQFAVDTMGVWAPKAPVSLTRSKLQFFEDTFLEFVEDGAFYFTIPIAGLILAKTINKLYGLDLKGDKVQKRLGTSLKDLSHHWPNEVTNKLIASKSGAAFGALGAALAFEFMIQHMKNVVTAKQFKTTNFTGVAGLEKSRTSIHDGEDDPVAKAKKRSLQVGGLTATTILGALLLPKMIGHFNWHGAAAKVLKHFDFESNLKKGAYFDTQKRFQALLTLVGLAGYLDASRDKLEWKEQLTRLGVVIPYLMFGKELTGNALASLSNRFFKLKVDNVDNKAKDGHIQEVSLSVQKFCDQHHIPESLRHHFSFLEDQSLINKVKDKSLNLSLVKENMADGFTKLEKALTQANIHLAPELMNSIKEQMVTRMGKINMGSYLLSAAICGVGINLIAYKMTKERFNTQQNKKNQQTLPLQPSVLWGSANRPVWPVTTQASFKPQAPGSAPAQNASLSLQPQNNAFSAWRSS